ncbi:MAG: hypothetical protein A2X12_03490 [Bacteroidetes bacterium GWE2_29_8]|nr:MAG: hypothetical protein A2X12_03490 [Bacteroidetes bacterium GWE2_29_8]OFY17400.1 MAG: hypothetical protein A2X02_00700 [Bacteroidetes bacterium GWF2_29_10]
MLENKFKLFILILLSILYKENYAQNKFKYAHLSDPITFKDSIEKRFTIEEVEKFVYADSTNNVLLENGYAQAKISNIAKWDAIKSNAIPQKVTVIFTKYPKNKEDWITNFYNLLGKRLIELYKLDSTLNFKNIKYHIILQTACNTEEETKSFFHGIKIDYINKTSNVSYDTLKVTTQTDDYSMKLIRNLTEKKPVKDSTLYKIIQRNNGWNNSLFAMNYTNSFFNDETVTLVINSVMLSKANNATVDYFVVLFNKSFDPLGSNIPEKVENVYINRSFNARSFSKEISLAKEQYSQCEAFISKMFYGKQNINNENIILIVNNYFDYEYLSLIDMNVPMKIIVKNAKKSNEINPLYFLLAKKTNATIHTINKDYSISEVNKYYEISKKNDPNVKKIEAELLKKNIKPSPSVHQKHKKTKELCCPKFN